MEVDKLQTARLIKNGRLAKGYTQQDLAEQTNVSLRSIQRIENGEVTARAYTLKLLATALELKLPVQLESQDEKTANEKSPLRNSNGLLLKKILFSAVGGICILLFSAAFLSQAPNFPETTFELFTFWGLVTSFYLIVLTRIFRVEKTAE